MDKRKFLQDALTKLAGTFPPEYGVKLDVTQHFIDRLILRYEGNWIEGVMKVVECVERQICIVIYYLHLDTALPERGKLDCGDYVIRGNVYGDRYVLSTFLYGEELN